MAYQALQKYIKHRYTAEGATNTNIWTNDSGQAQGRYFNSKLSSAFQTVRSTLDLEVVGYQGFARSSAPNQNSEEGLSLWRLLEHSASDDESIELDRLCRVLHAINFYRQPQALGQDLYLHVHSRLLAAVSHNHGAAFRHILETLELPHQHIVLELPLIAPNQGWILNHVAGNYQHNGFRIVVNADSIEQAIELSSHAHVDAVKLDGGHVINSSSLERLVAVASEHKTTIMFKKIECLDRYRTIVNAASASAQEIYVQGFLFNKPNASLFTLPCKVAAQSRTKVCRC